MKYFIIFWLIFLFGCLNNHEDLLEEEEDHHFDEEVGQKPIVESNPPYRKGCGESTFHNDVLGNEFSLPIFCEDFYIEKGRPSDKFAPIHFNDDIYQQYILTNKSFSENDS